MTGTLGSSRSCESWASFTSSSRRFQPPRTLFPLRHLLHLLSVGVGHRDPGLATPPRLPLRASSHLLEPITHTPRTRSDPTASRKHTKADTMGLPAKMALGLGLVLAVAPSASGWQAPTTRSLFPGATTSSLFPSTKARPLTATGAGQEVGTGEGTGAAKGTASGAGTEGAFAALNTRDEVDLESPQSTVSVGVGGLGGGGSVSVCVWFEGGGCSNLQGVYSISSSSPPDPTHALAHSHSHADTV